MPDVEVIHTFVDPETGEKSDHPFPSHIERIAAALAKSVEEDEQRKAG